MEGIGKLQIAGFFAEIRRRWTVTVCSEALVALFRQTKYKDDKGLIWCGLTTRITRIGQHLLPFSTLVLLLFDISNALHDWDSPGTVDRGKQGQRQPPQSTFVWPSLSPPPSITKLCEYDLRHSPLPSTVNMFQNSCVALMQKVTFDIKHHLQNESSSPTGMPRRRISSIDVVTKCRLSLEGRLKTWAQNYHTSENPTVTVCNFCNFKLLQNISTLLCWVFKCHELTSILEV